MSCQAQGNSAYVLDIIAGMSDWGRKLQNDCSSLLSTHTCYSPMVRRYNVSLWACRHSWEPAFDFCQCLIKIMLMLLILTIKLWLCKTKQKEKKKFTTVLSILFIYHFPSPLNRQWWGMSASKLSVAVLQIYWWGLKFHKSAKTPVLFWALHSQGSSKFQPTEVEAPQILKSTVAPRYSNIFACYAKLSKQFQFFFLYFIEIVIHCFLGGQKWCYFVKS